MGDKLYLVDMPRRSNYAEAALIPAEYDYSRYISCPRCGEQVSGVYWKRPREIVLTSRKAPDFLYTYTDNAPFLLSERALKVVLQAGLKGIKCAEKIESSRFQRKSKSDASPPTYYHIELERSLITIDHKNSIISYGETSRKICPLCQQVSATYDFFRSLSFHMDSFEGFDIFQIYELGDTVFLSQRFVDLCIANKLTNLHYSLAEKHGRWAAAYFLDGNEDA